MKRLSAVSQPVPDEQGTYQVQIPDDWSQGRTAFGGLLASIAVRAMEHKQELVQQPAPRYLRSVLVCFVAPVFPGAIRIEVNTHRSGRSLTSLEAKITQSGQICTQVTACYGARRKTCINISAPQRPDTPRPNTIPPMPYVPGIVPAFSQHFDFRWTSPLPYSGAKQAHIQGWIRPHDDSPLHTSALLSLMDAWPPPEIITQDHPYPLSSVTWQTNFLSPLPAQGVTPDAWWFFDASTNWACDGYSESRSSLWDPDGYLVANSIQLVAEFSTDCS